MTSQANLVPELMTTAIERKPVQSATTTPMELLAIAVSQNADMDKLAKLLELQQKWEANEARKAFVAAMNDFKKAPPTITKNKHVSFGNTNYDHATLDHVCESVIAGLSKHGLSHRWKVEQSEGRIKVSCIITHEQGHSEETTLEATADTSGSKNSIQAIASAVTYLERYTLLAATGLAAKGTDDDGYASSAMDENAVRDWISAIEAAASLDELQQVFRNAYKAASECKDRQAQAAFVQAKDARKRQVRQ